MRLLNIYYLCLFLLIMAACGTKNTNTVYSPDKTISLQIEPDKGKLYYTVTKNGEVILNPSFLGFELQDGTLGTGMEIKSIRHSSASESWDQIWGEEITVDNTYNEMIVEVQETAGLKRLFMVTFRVFNDGVGFRYEFPQQPDLSEFVIMEELTEFNLAVDADAWSIPYDTEFYEGLYTRKPIHSLDTVCTPLTIETDNGLYLTIHQADLTDYATMNLYPENGKLRTYLTPWSTGEKVFMEAPRTTPWRTMIIAEKPGDLILSRLMLNLNEPCKIEDTSWIKPGRYIGIWWAIHMKNYTWEQGPKHGATTANTKRYMDFAAKHNFAGVLVEGWNKGWEEWKDYSFTEAYPDFDIEEITRYGREIGVDLIGHHETGGNISDYEEQLEDAFAYYQRLGVHAVKTGYVGVGGILDGKERHSSQYGVRHYRKVIETAARYQIMIDNHEPAMPTGLQRTWPNLMTQEGVRGQEWDAWSADGGNPPEHTTIIPFTRGLAGPMDFTPGTFRFENPVLPDTRVQTTLAKQLALSVVLFSPLQMASDMIENYEGNPAFEFITSCPVNWAKTVVPEAKIGEYVTIARKDRETDSWYVGSITNANKREMFLTLDFLDQESKYVAKIFKDGQNADWQSNPYPVDIEEVEVTSETVLVVPQANSGGTAIIITKI